MENRHARVRDKTVHASTSVRRHAASVRKVLDRSLCHAAGRPRGDTGAAVGQLERHTSKRRRVATQLYSTRCDIASRRIARMCVGLEAHEHADGRGHTALKRILVFLMKIMTQRHQTFSVRSVNPKR
ncbi:hypothetical protein EVAR_99206_1 [Eumeta japonica]|uniref:Uncharacterized protein n=1 Tax=Eumeta variegata TaxID=151549 RepID=A0A4C1YNX9_EUMVA|nr:hypothetical protein EVAR_99206_1 [Eumeta japonica]